MNDYIKTLIDANRDAIDNIAVLEETVKNFLLLMKSLKLTLVICVFFLMVIEM